MEEAWTTWIYIAGKALRICTCVKAILVYQSEIAPSAQSLDR